jgi:5-formyltetrahydrofolate cyclo-ligase
MTKEQLRKMYKEKRKELSEGQMDRFNDLLLIGFQKINLHFINCIHTYLSSLKLREPDTCKLVRFLQFRNPHIKVAVPKIDMHKNHMEHVEFEASTELINNIYGIPEPAGGSLIREKDMDVILVPLLAFDNRGFRVGYGKGYYDRFLANCRKDAIKIGLSFFEPVERIEDIDQFDIPLNYCVTPKQLFVF